MERNKVTKYSEKKKKIKDTNKDIFKVSFFN